MANKKAKKNNSILRDKPEIGGMDRVINAAITGASTVAGVAASKLAEQYTEPHNLKKFHGPALMALGLASAYFVENEQVAAIGNGLIASGAIVTAKEFVPEDKKEAYGLGMLSEGSTATQKANVQMLGITERDYVPAYMPSHITTEAEYSIIKEENDSLSGVESVEML